MDLEERARCYPVKKLREGEDFELSALEQLLPLTLHDRGSEVTVGLLTCVDAKEA